MAYIVRQKVGSHVYLYEAVSYRNEEGKPRSRRVTVGKLDKDGQPVYKDEYVRRMAEAGTPVQANAAYTRNDIAGSSIKEFGSFYLLHAIADDIGLLAILEDVFPDKWREVFDRVFCTAEHEPVLSSATGSRSCTARTGCQKPTPSPQA
jgi:hypothetical protein